MQRMYTCVTVNSEDLLGVRDNNVLAGKNNPMNELR